MKPIIAGLVLVFGGAVLAGTTATSNAQQAQPKPSEPAHKVYVLAGCLRGNGDTTPAFKLTAAVPVGHTPPERPAAGANAKDVYELQPTSGLTEQGIGRAELDSHADKKVEVTVRPVEVALGPSPSSSSAAPARVEEATPTRYTVTAIKLLPGACATE